MARYAFKNLEVAQVSKKMTVNYRYRLQDAALKASVQKAGVLVPLIVSGGARPEIIAGHKRFVAACEGGIKEVPALEAGTVSPQDAFILNLVSNWRQGYSEMDRAQAVALASGPLGFKEPEVLGQVMPLLGLPEEKAVFELYRKVHDFPASLKDLLEDGRMPFRGVPFLVRFSRTEQDLFAREVGGRARLTSSQLLQAGEWLVDAVKGSRKGLEALFQEHKLAEGLDHPTMDSRTKADLFFARVKQLRFPEYTVYLERFEAQSGDIFRDTTNFRIRPIEGFEERGFEIQARIRTEADLDALLQKLSQERSALNSLFDVML